jgi:hypothetical protein
MQKIIQLYIALGMFNFIQGQEFKNLKIDVLVTQLSYSVKDIKPVYHNSKMYYVNTNDNSRLFSKKFEVAYPFFKKSALVKNNGKYGIVDLKGNYLVQPIHDTFSLAPYEHECYIVIFNKNNIFDLNRAQKTDSYTICEEYALPERYFFKGENEKYGVKKEDSIIINARYDTIFTVDSKFIIASMNEKIGVIDNNDNRLIDFIYDDLIYSKDESFQYTYPVFGLKKDEEWVYFKNGTKIIESPYNCTSFTTSLKNSIGIFTTKGKKNILFKNGSTLNNSYDFISENGLVGIRNNKVFLINSDGSEQLYYKQ